MSEMSEGTEEKVVKKKVSKKKVSKKAAKEVEKAEKKKIFLGYCVKTGEPLYKEI